MYIHTDALSNMGTIQLNSACLKIPVWDIEISVAFDNSCGASPHLTRMDVRIYKGEVDITEEILGDERNGYITSFDQLVNIVNEVKNVKGE